MVDSAAQTVATSPLLETKLYVPRWRTGLVPRGRLIERLDQGIERKLILVSAPAGCGKTTVLAEWVAATPASEQSAAWVSLDQSDNDPALFWAYFIAALQTVRPGVGESALSLLHSPQPPPIESVLTTLINEINAIQDDFALILDDYPLSTPAYPQWHYLSPGPSAAADAPDHRWPFRPTPAAGAPAWPRRVDWATGLPTCVSPPTRRLLSSTR